MGGNVFKNRFRTHWHTRISKIFLVGFLSVKKIRKSAISIELSLRDTTSRINQDDRSSAIK